jgi:hypothetical protein
MSYIVERDREVIIKDEPVRKEREAVVAYLKVLSRPG